MGHLAINEAERDQIRWVLDFVEALDWYGSLAGVRISGR